MSGYLHTPRYLLIISGVFSLEKMWENMKKISAVFCGRDWGNISVAATAGLGFKQLKGVCVIRP